MPGGNPVTTRHLRVTISQKMFITDVWEDENEPLNSLAINIPSYE